MSVAAAETKAPDAEAPVAIAIPAPGPDVLRQLVRELQDAEIAARTANDAATSARGRAVATEAALRAALGVPAGAVLDLQAGVFQPA